MAGRDDDSFDAADTPPDDDPADDDEDDDGWNTARHDAWSSSLCEEIRFIPRNTLSLLESSTTNKAWLPSLVMSTVAIRADVEFK